MTNADHTAAIRLAKESGFLLADQNPNDAYQFERFRQLCRAELLAEKAYKPTPCPATIISPPAYCAEQAAKPATCPVCQGTGLSGPLQNCICTYAAKPATITLTDQSGLAVSVQSYGGTTGINDYLMADGSVKAMRPDEVKWATQPIKPAGYVRKYALEHLGSGGHTVIDKSPRADDDLPLFTHAKPICQPTPAQEQALNELSALSEKLGGYEPAQPSGDLPEEVPIPIGRSLESAYRTLQSLAAENAELREELIAANKLKNLWECCAEEALEQKFDDDVTILEAKGQVESLDMDNNKLRAELDTLRIRKATELDKAHGENCRLTRENAELKADQAEENRLKLKLQAIQRQIDEAGKQEPTKEFYNLMQTYRHAPATDQASVIRAYEAVWRYKK